VPPTLTLFTILGISFHGDTGIFTPPLDKLAALVLLTEEVANGVQVTPATLYWKKEANQWNRCGEDYVWTTEPCEWVSFVVVPHSQIELEDGIIVRDYMELCSPDAEQYYTQRLLSQPSSSTL
jgi:hypothetical protein